MKCLKCWDESKYQFCRKCKEDKHKAGAIISQNKTKLKDLLNYNILEPEIFSRFILYTDNIIKRWKIYMEYKSRKQNLLFKIITWSTITCSVIISLWSIASLIILEI